MIRQNKLLSGHIACISTNICLFASYIIIMMINLYILIPGDVLSPFHMCSALFMHYLLKASISDEARFNPRFTWPMTKAAELFPLNANSCYLHINDLQLNLNSSKVRTVLSILGSLSVTEPYLENVFTTFILDFPLIHKLGCLT